jgi:hypothetical protein
MNEYVDKIHEKVTGGHYVLGDGRFYLRVHDTLVEMDFKDVPESVITEAELQAFLKRYKRSDFPEYFQDLISDNVAYPSSPLTTKSAADTSAKALFHLGILLGVLRKFWPALGSDHATANSKRIIRPPGSGLNSAAEFLFSRKTMERVVNPVISDLQMEYCEALAANRRVKAIWVQIRGYWSFFKTVGLYSVLKAFVEIWRKVSAG